MGIIVRANVDASSYATKAITAVTRGLMGMWYFDTSIAKATNDFSTQSNALTTQLGAVTVQPDRCGFVARTNYFMTDIAEPDAFTFAMVLRCVNGPADAVTSANKRGFALGNYDTPAAGAVGIALGFQGTAGSLSFGRSLLNASGQPTFISAGFGTTYYDTNWALFYGTFDPATYASSITNATSGATATSSGAGVTGLNKGPGKILIGSAYTATSQLGGMELSQLRLFNTVLTNVEMAQIVAEMRRYELSHNARTV
jgi:hypothetical protein